MAFTIAVSGKGGVGKTTLAALMVRYIARELGRAVLAVDADPNASLGVVLGLDVPATVADIRDDVVEKRVELSAGMSKEREIEYRIQQSVLEATGFDLLTMGRPEGPKCYCYVNNLLRKYLDQAAQDYPFVVVDNEAGMEHLSRRTTNNVDLLLIVTEPTTVGVATAQRIWKLAEELPILVRKKETAFNRVPPQGVAAAIGERMAQMGLTAAVQFGWDDEIYQAASSGKSLLDLPDTNATYRKVVQFLRERLNTK
ncbi:MAG: carbon monoxide dehydrogenase [Planctomycetes bacterium]|nr:carbon monoxide dehydrogenase [Planctomycetota bacterium]MBM4079051.1 carbon monoxide dehydrogenase [Planctomycetota bacterium]MBM4086102.1 carbon monoxide dehydrogenase [Planctomycetota bacterium]